MALILIAISLLSDLQGQHSLTDIRTTTVSQRVVRYASGSYSFVSDLLIGKCFFDIWRSYRQGLCFGLNGIPSNATITGCHLHFRTGNTCSENITQLGRIVFVKLNPSFVNYSQASNLWNDISNGEQFDSIWINLYQGDVALNLPSLVADLQNALGASPYRVGLGVKFSVNAINKGTDFIYPFLDINYTLPTPPKVTNLSTSSITATSMILSWSPASGNVTGYHIYKNNVLYSTTTSTNISITGLCPDVNYKLNVEAYNSHGSGDLSSDLYGRTLATNISGNPVLCSVGANYTALNLPTDASLTWNKSTNIQMMSSPTSNPCNFQGQDWGGQGWVSVLVNSATCGTNTYSLDVWSGRPWAPTVYPSGIPALTMGIYSPLYVALLTSPGAYHMDAYWSSSGSLSTTSSNGNCGFFYSESPGTGYFFVTTYNACGDGPMYQGEVWVDEHQMTRITPDDNLKISPNPSSDYINIDLENVSKNIDGTYSILIVDSYGRTRKNLRLNGTYNQVNIQDLNKGSYFIVLKLNTVIYQQQFIIDR